jgi:hypothetical protein
MNRNALLVGAVFVVFVAGRNTWGDRPDGAQVAGTQSGRAGEVTPQAEKPAPITIAEARRQASLLHDTYLATLHVVHREYFDAKQRDTLPARALEDVFKQIDKTTKGHTRWISVNVPAMNIDHEPQTDFEKDAARALSNGSKEFERIEKGLYHRAGAVTLFASCNKCHSSGLGQRRAGRVAALVITLPVRDK